jgi:hypothetical protein
MQATQVGTPSPLSGITDGKHVPTLIKQNKKNKTNYL